MERLPRQRVVACGVQVVNQRRVLLGAQLCCQPQKDFEFGDLGVGMRGRIRLGLSPDRVGLNGKPALQGLKLTASGQGSSGGQTSPGAVLHSHSLPACGGFGHAESMPIKARPEYIFVICCSRLKCRGRSIP